MASLFDHLFKAPNPQNFSNIMSLKRTGKPNEAMIVPVDADAPDPKGKLHCLVGTHYALPADDVLKRAIDHLIDAEDATILTSNTPENGAALCMRTKLMRYPDMVYLQARALSGDQAGVTLGAYSHSVYGRSDLGVNAKRLTGLQKALKEHEIDKKFA